MPPPQPPPTPPQVCVFPCFTHQTMGSNPNPHGVTTSRPPMTLHRRARGYIALSGCGVSRDHRAMTSDPGGGGGGQVARAGYLQREVTSSDVIAPLFHNPLATHFLLHRRRFLLLRRQSRNVIGSLRDSPGFPPQSGYTPPPPPTT